MKKGPRKILFLPSVDISQTMKFITFANKEQNLITRLFGYCNGTYVILFDGTVCFPLKDNIGSKRKMKGARIFIFKKKVLYVLKIYLCA